MNKQQLHQQVCARLAADLELAIRAAEAAHQAATNEESKAENKYDTRGLEASYLAAGQSRRVEEIRQALAAWRNLVPRDYDEEQGIQLGTLVHLLGRDGQRQCLLLGPDGAGLKLPGEAGEIMLITPRAPLGQQLLGQGPGDEVGIGQQRWLIEHAE
ncbi:transcription elongation factor GreAB [Pseudomonas alcaligenes]|uniref:Transcription elongation factor GreAB n=1 Tax=Aquipseudomonas alcaligenes TaxID=43263 RepID=A0ABR7RWN4_AQUAC|nr:transcription elongation factor GreAB [Pseudomonas alcaligenes]MBC9248955.1 transcription elongation factor GreAB [Pseudomonas alcaligenes]